MKPSIILLTLLMFLINLDNLIGNNRDTLTYPTVGKMCPDFELTNIKYFKLHKATLDNFKGKWLVLDFWTEYCGGCIKSFPKVDSLNKEYADKVQFMLVGVPYKNPESVYKIFERSKSRYKLNLPVCYDDSLFSQLGGDAYPYIVIVDPSGIVRGITYTIDRSIINEFLEGKEPRLPKYVQAGKMKSHHNYNSAIPLFLNGNGGSEEEVIFRSLVTKWNDKIPQARVQEGPGRFEVLGFDLKSLYRLAYTGASYWSASNQILYGNFYLDPLLNLKDSSLFSTGKFLNDNLFCYSMINSMIDSSINFGNSKEMQLQLQRDLENSFGYSAHIETRDMPCYLLVLKTDVKKLKSKGGEREYRPDYYGLRQGLHAKNIDVGMLIGHMSGTLNYPKNIPIIDSTGINSNIDIDIKGMYFDEKIQSLREQGLDLILAKKAMKVLVVQERPQKNALVNK